MCGRYYVDDETSREIEKIVRKLDQRLKIEHGQDIHPSESAVILTKECKEVAARQMQWGFPGFQGKGLLINARAEAILDKTGMQSHSGVASKMFEALSNNNINIKRPLFTSPR